MTMSMNDFESLLEKIKELRRGAKRLPTFMEIAGYPHYENVCSNILAFFLDPEEQHGLGVLVLDALAHVGSISTEEGVWSNISVEREIPTEAGNRIDILIESDTHAILIENKIFAGVANPLSDYANYLDKRTPDEREQHKFLLTLFPTPIDEAHSGGFVNLTYAKLVERIRSLLGHYISEADTRYLTLISDFLSTLDHLQEGTRMNSEFVKLLAERKDSVGFFLSELKEFSTELRSKVQELETLLDVSKYPNVVKQGLWREKEKLYDTLFYDVRISEEVKVAIDTIVSAQGWEIQIFPRRKDDFPRLKEMFQHRGIPFEEGKHFAKPTRSVLFVGHNRFAYSESLDNVRVELQALIDQLVTES